MESGCVGDVHVVLLDLLGQSRVNNISEDRYKGWSQYMVLCIGIVCFTNRLFLSDTSKPTRFSQSTVEWEDAAL
jgi:hypothetical protein